MKTAEPEVEENGRQKGEESKKNKDETKPFIVRRKSKKRDSIGIAAPLNLLPSSYFSFTIHYCKLQTTNNKCTGS